MSLHALAGHMASKGRGSDSMLVHMTPEEVQSLQVLALKGGGTLTINPDTGLPEANFLKKMLPMIAGFALGPAGFGLMSAGMAGAAVGGITALSTGSLSRGLMAGLGAYGGASLGGSLAGAGAGTSAANAAALGVEGAATGIGSQAAMLAEQTAGFGAEGLSSLADSARVAAGAAPSKAGMLSAGFDAVTKSPEALGKFAKSNYGALAAALSPMMAADTVQTTTKRPDTGTIRNYTFDPYGQTYTSAGNYPASEYKGMAQGGIVALAAGGTPSYFAANPDVAAAFKENAYGLTPEQFAQTHYEKFGQTEQRAAPTAGVSDEGVRGYLAARPGLSDIAIQQAMDQYGVSADQMARATGVGLTDVQDRYGLAKDINAFSQTSPNLTDLQFAQYAVARDPGTFDPASMAELSRATGVPLEQVTQRYNAVQHGLRAPEGGGDAAQKYLRENKDVAAWTQSQEGRDYMRTHAMTADDIAFTHFNRYGIGEGRKWGATTPTTTPPVTAANPDIPGDITKGIGSLPGGVSGGGNTVLNPNGTVTTAPAIPGRPAGGFTGIGQLKDVYTQGGGSLGYTNAAPKTMEDFDQRFNTQMGDSLAAYNYLVGKGANPIKSGVGEIMRPYDEAVRGVPAAKGRPTQKFIYENGKYVENPNYRPMSYDSKGNRNVGMTSGEVIRGFQALPDKADDTAIFDWVGENKVSIAQLAAAMGVSVAEAQRRMNAVGKKKGAVVDNAGYISDGGGGDSGSAGASGDGSSGSSGTSGDAAAAAAADGAAADGPGTGAGWAYGGQVRRMALGGLGALAGGGSTSQYNLGGYSDGGRLLRGPGDGVSDSIPATIGNKQPARLADGEFVVPARIVSELGNGSTEAGARKLYAMMDRVQKARGKTTGKNRVAANTRSEKYLPA